ncbi:gamma subclass chorismate mutase AroQ [Undibacterium sp. TS12]|uniref:gamma subclass chorismate mutase AroQ n=1 Tax=Undibacterium sp. TS12 TaxID=2908202 RepID=UPI001F4CADA8|nr:gamma subclass chorismate mutase AroQ [Undibacterium sp. TS12]MCH8619533.1 gamma subclass chorismate mutase AroQ [Undibacterium sp. TS12]
MNKTLFKLPDVMQRSSLNVFKLCLFCLMFASASIVMATAAHAKVDAIAESSADPRLARLLTLIQQRLNLAQDVAMYKWNTRAAIDDPVREQQILDALALQAPQYGLEPKMAQDFFARQIIAGKMIQTALFAEWTDRQQPPFSNPPDLKNKIRPALDQLTTELLTALAAAQPLLQTPAGRSGMELAIADATAQTSLPAYARAWQTALGGWGK